MRQFKSMKNTNSQNKYNRTQPPSNLMKTTTTNRNSNMQNTNLNRPASSKRVESSKKIPPKPPVSKKEYIVEDNMTVSRIHEAKQGLQLLKKKMSAKGMSREKISANQIRQEKPMMRKTNTKIQEPPNRESFSGYGGRAEKKSLDYEVEQKKPTPKPATKAFKPREEKKQLAEKYDSYEDQKMEAPLGPKKDFNALLEQEMRKERKTMASQQKTYQNYQQDNEGQLIQCSKGCGRMFNPTTLIKHEKICQKVFQSKRKAFDSAAHRAPEVEGGFQKPMQTFGKTKKVQQPVKKEEKGKIPKWKQQSLAFRASMKQNRNEPITAQEKQINQQIDTRIKCNFCGRKFEQTAAARHIPFCEKKSKQIPKAPVKRKR